MPYKYCRMLLITLVLVLFAFACGSAPVSSEEETAPTTQALVTPVTVSMWIAHLTPAPTNGLYAVLHDDAAHPTPTLTSVSTFNNHVGLSSVYQSLSMAAVLNLSTTDWNTLVADMSLGVSAGDWVKLIITYDSSAVGASKPIIANPGGVPQINLCTNVGLAFGPNCG